MTKLATVATISLAFACAICAQSMTENKNITFTFQKFHKVGIYQCPIFLLKNNTDTTFFATGFGTVMDSSVGMLTNIICSREEKRNGKWQRERAMGYCGNGLVTDTLHARGQVFVQFFPNQKEDAEAVRFSVDLRPINSNRWRSVTSDEIVLK